MDASPGSPKRHKRLSLILQFGPLANADIPSDIEHSMPGMGDTDDSPPAETEPPRKAAPIVRSRRNPSTSSHVTPTLTSFLGLKTTSSASDGHASPKETRSRLVKTKSLKKAHGLSDVLSQMSAPNSPSPEPEVEDVKELPDRQSRSSTTRHTPRTSISAAAHIQRVKDTVRPRPSLSIKKSKTPRHEKGMAISNTSSVHGNSSSSPSVRIPVDFGEPSNTPMSPLAAGPEQSTALSRDTPLSSHTLNDTAGAIRKATAKQRRRMSFDFASLKQPRQSLPTSLNPAQMQRSQSLYRQQKGYAHRQSTEFVDIKGDLREPMSERQRALNVKRARKMAQVFGTEPPTSLYQITTRDDEDEDDGLITPVEERMLDSLANIFSSSRLPTPSTRSRSSSTSSAVVVYSHQDDESAGQRSDRPKTPPPFTSQAVSEPLPSGSPTPSFKARRRRAAKLAQFFGVGYRHLSESMSLASTSSPSEIAESRPDTPITHTMPSSSVQVDVEVNGPARFWGIVDGRRDMTHASMDDVIDRLREMKAK